MRTSVIYIKGENSFKRNNDFEIPNMSSKIMKTDDQNKKLILTDKQEMIFKEEDPATSAHSSKVNETPLVAYTKLAVGKFIEMIKLAGTYTSGHKNIRIVSSTPADKPNNLQDNKENIPPEIIMLEKQEDGKHSSKKDLSAKFRGKKVIMIKYS